MAIFGFIVAVAIALYATFACIVIIFATIAGFSAKGELLFFLVPTVGLWYAVFHFSPFTLVVS